MCVCVCEVFFFLIFIIKIIAIVIMQINSLKVNYTDINILFNKKIYYLSKYASLISLSFEYFVKLFFQTFLLFNHLKFKFKFQMILSRNIGMFSTHFFFFSL